MPLVNRKKKITKGFQELSFTGMGCKDNQKTQCLPPCHKSLKTVKSEEQCLVLVFNSTKHFTGTNGNDERGC